MPVNRNTEHERTTARLPSNLMMFLEFPAATALFIIASLNLAYRPLWLILLASALLFAAFHAYLRWRFGLQVPAVALILAFAAVGIDTAGNYFRWYQQLPWPIAYDVLAHATIPALLTPALILLLRAWLAKLGYRLPLSVLAFFAANVNFSLTAFYEITEMWDDLYFGGQRIKGIFDTSRDLQFDLIACIGGAVLTYAVMKRIELAVRHSLGKTRRIRHEISEHSR